MTIDEAIKHAKEVAREQEELYRLCPASESEIFHCDGTKDCKILKNGKNKGCQKCAEEHRQLAEWLKELQAHRYAWAKLREDIKDEAEFAYADFDEYKYEVLGIDDVDDLPNDDYRYGMERALELIDIYRPKERDNNDNKE